MADKKIKIYGYGEIDFPISVLTKARIFFRIFHDTIGDVETKRFIFFV